MKNKKLFLPTVILIAAVLSIALCSVLMSIAKKPTVTEGEFPFSITYELDGETVTINDVYKTRYTGNDGYADTLTRIYVGEIGKMGEGNTWYTLKTDETGRIEMCTNLYADYMMGDPEYDYFDDEAFEPQIFYYDLEEQEYSDEATLAAHGVKLVSFEYPEPIENSFEFSHISYFSSVVSLPAEIIAILALIAVIIFVKKEKEFKYGAMYIVSVSLDCVIGLTLIPFLVVVAMFVDINGGSPELYHQMMYFLPAFCILCTAASVALLRKKYYKSAIVAELIGPAVFAVYIVVCSIIELM